ncbi:hypothetical protein [Actinomadura sp. SCN-SB]|uniref:hypothetical protein n=1 Tax=Actinomadura sp. SCN-SB TaxID=3373092 RepID=UPI003752EB04
MRVREAQTVTEKWRFQCLRCLRVWEDLYQARYHGDATVWWLSGVPAQPPWADPICPGCLGLLVKAHATGPVAH